MAPRSKQSQLSVSGSACQPSRCAGECTMPLDSHSDHDRPISVLLVDDDVDSRDMYAAALQPDVIVTDFVLKGGENGAALCRWLHSDPRTAGIKVLVVTGSTRKNDAE